jgi:hypothetical protein
MIVINFQAQLENGRKGGREEGREERLTFADRAFVA